MLGKFTILPEPGRIDNLRRYRHPTERRLGCSYVDHYDASRCSIPAAEAYILDGDRVYWTVIESMLGLFCVTLGSDRRELRGGSREVQSGPTRHRRRRFAAVVVGMLRSRIDRIECGGTMERSL